VSNVTNMKFMFDGALSFNIQENATWYIEHIEL